MRLANPPPEKEWNGWQLFFFILGLPFLLLGVIVQAYWKSEGRHFRKLRHQTKGVEQQVAHLPPLPGLEAVFAEVRQALLEKYPNASDRIMAHAAAIVRSVYLADFDFAWRAQPPLDPIELATYRAELSRQIGYRSDPRCCAVMTDALKESLLLFLANWPSLGDDAPGTTAAFSVPFTSMHENVEGLIYYVLRPFWSDECKRYGVCETLCGTYKDNLAEASDRFLSKQEREEGKVVGSGDHPGTPEEIAADYLKGTPFLDLFQERVPFAFADAQRFEHMHIVAGSGHGKTQTLQHLIMADLKRPDPPGIVIIDSQGDMIRKISRLALFNGTLRDKLIIIDPKDIEHPPALNMFDVNLGRLRKYGTADREQILNGIIELYEYFFGSLLGAELTQKQSLIFRYLARLMIHIPAATIRTMIELMDDTKPYRQVIEGLPDGIRLFFEREFNDSSYFDTRKQIKRRLYGIVENQTFDRMFSAPRNRIDIPSALNEGKIVLVSTAKDFLKGGSSILGRYFIALTLQAALERAAIPENQRRPAYLYIDEAAEYFDDNIDNLLTQARKYKLGLILAHQYLDQLSSGLRPSIAANTTIKLAGGVSDQDAHAMSRDMRTTPAFILQQRKQAASTQFACYVRNLTPSALSLSVPFGTMEAEPVMADDGYRSLLAVNRRKVSAVASDEANPPYDGEEPIITLHHPDLPWELEREPKQNGAEASPPPKASVENADYYCEITLTVMQAAKGFTTDIRTPESTYEVDIPAGLQDGTRLRLQGARQRQDGPAGDVYICVHVTDLPRERGTEVPTSDAAAKGERREPYLRTSPPNDTNTDPSPEW